MQTPGGPFDTSEAIVREATYERHMHHEPAAVSDFLAELCHDAKWRNEVTATELVSGTTATAGAIYRESVSWEGLFAATTLTLAEVTRGARLVIVAEDPGYRATYEYTFTPGRTGDGTDLVLHAVVQTTGPIQLIEPFLWAIVTRWLERGLDALDAAIGTEPAGR